MRTPLSLGHFPLECDAQIIIFPLHHFKPFSLYHFNSTIANNTLFLPFLHRRTTQIHPIPLLLLLLLLCTDYLCILCTYSHSIHQKNRSTNTVLIIRPTTNYHNAPHRTILTHPYLMIDSKCDVTCCTSPLSSHLSI